MTGYWQKKAPIILAIDSRSVREASRSEKRLRQRTSWRKYNVLVVSWIIQGRAIPIN